MLNNQEIRTNKFYAGIGSRETPSYIEPMIEEVSFFLSKFGYILRSGAATGADSMFEKYSVKKEIYLPWANFNKSTSEFYLDKIDPHIVEKSSEIAKKYHPSWFSLSDAGKKLMTRNTFQILGSDLQTPVKFVICWTRGGGIKGGTGQAMRIAKDHGIPIFNLYNKDAVYKIKLFIHQNQ